MALALLLIVVVLTWQKGTTAKDARSAAETAKKMATETVSWAIWVSDQIIT